MRVDEHTINLDESPVFYRTAETPGMPTLYLHGIPTSWDDWVEFLARTGGIAPDLIGFGRSGKGGHLDYSLAGLAGFVERFLAEVHVGAVRLVAHDWGAAVGLMLAHRHPERVERLVCCNPPPLLDGFGWPRMLKWWRVPLHRRGPDGVDDAWDTRAGAAPRVRPPRSVDGRADRAACGTSSIREPSGRSSVWCGRQQPSWRAPTSRTPALIVWGDRDPWYPPALADAYAAHLRARRSSDCPMPDTGRGSTGAIWSSAWQISWRGSRAGPRQPSHPPPDGAARAARDASRTRDAERVRLLKRILPTFTAGVIALAYVLIAPRSQDLAAHLLRAKLFATEGFGIWNNWWYAGHNIPGYSVLFPPLAALFTPQLVAAICGDRQRRAVRVAGSPALRGGLLARRVVVRSGDVDKPVHGTADVRVRSHAGRRQRARARAPAAGLAVALAFVTPLASPVGALFSALAGGAQAVSAFLPERRIRPALPGIGVVIASAVPILALAVAFPEGGIEPFAFSAFWPIVVISITALLVIPRRDLTLETGVALYALGCIAFYLVASPVGSNVTRLAPMVAGPLVALLWWPRRTLALVLVALPLSYVQWQIPVRDIRTADDNAEVSAAYFQPIVSYLSRQSGQPFRIEIPFTLFHWEAYWSRPSSRSPAGGSASSTSSTTRCSTTGR